jgi:hypothetical protein
MRSTTLLPLAALLLSAPAFAQSYAPGAKPAVDEEPAYAEAPAPSRGPVAAGNDHTGLMIRLSAGIGVGAVTEDWPSTTLKSSGPAGVYSFAIGGAVSPNLAMGADFFGFGLSEPKLTYGGTSYGTQQNTSVNVGGVGFNTTYFFMPSNVYVSGTLGLVQVSRNKYSSSGSSQTLTTDDPSRGLGVSLMVGKEWMVSRDWGLGVAGQFIGTSTSKTDAGSDVSVGSAAFGVSFTATYF